MTGAPRSPYRDGVTSDAEPDDTLPTYVRALLEPAAYAHDPTSVQLIQTHISYVFLADDLVYKTKKPVSFGFIDQVTLEAREENCRAEVTLNRRLAPTVYLDVAPVTQFADGHFEIDSPGASEGETVEWAVKMARLPEDRTLDELLAAGHAPSDIAERLVGKLVPFHRAAERVPNNPAFAGAEAQRQWWAREFDECATFIDGTWRRDDAQTLRAFVETRLEALAPVFDERLAAGRVVDGHGDLRCKHVYVMGNGEDELLIVDCIEYSDWFQFRLADVGYDIAFLAMDLEAKGRPDLADEFAGRYLAATADETLGLTQPLYRAYRAFIRGKVGSLGTQGAEIPAEQRQQMKESAERYFRLASTFTRRQAGPVLVVMSGLSGTGKSIVGATLAARVGAAYVSSDAVRKELAGLEAQTRAGSEFQTGLYTADITARTYDEIRRRAHAYLEQGHPVILDATHTRRAERIAAVEVARQAGVRCLLVELQLSKEIALERIAARRTDPLATSDADEDIYQRQVEGYVPVDPSEGDVLALDASQSVASLAQEIAAALPSPS